MEKSYKILEMERECRKINKRKYKATIAAIGSTFILGMISVALIAITCFEPLNTIDKEMRELLIMILSVTGIVDLYFVFNSICRKIGLELLMQKIKLETKIAKAEEDDFEESLHR